MIAGLPSSVRTKHRRTAQYVCLVPELSVGGEACPFFLYSKYLRTRSAAVQCESSQHEQNCDKYVAADKTSGLDVRATQNIAITGLDSGTSAR